ncbi:MAG: c-type cytochrome [Rhodothermales bacterium]
MVANSTHARWSRRLLLAGLLLMLAPSTLLAQQWRWPDKAENLKVLPEDTTPDQLRDTMIGFVRALDVRCSHCHDDRNGTRLNQMDFPSDFKETKKMARVMMRMVRRINDEHLDELGALGRPAADRVQVTCVTCHRGNTRPRMLEEVLAETLENDGMEATIAKYRELRETYYGGFTYDFGESVLMNFAQQLMGQEKKDEAFAILALNLEMYPASWQTHASFGQIHLQSGDNTAALASFEKALELNPENRFLQQQVEQLKSQ